MAFRLEPELQAVAEAVKRTSNDLPRISDSIISLHNFMRRHGCDPEDPQVYAALMASHAMMLGNVERSMWETYSKMTVITCLAVIDQLNERG